jgi:predicted esterase
MMRSGLLLWIALAAGAPLMCTGRPGESGAATSDGRLRARPGKPSATVEPGRHALKIGEGRDGLLYVPRGYRPDKPAPLVVMLHGARGQARISDTTQQLADELGVVVLAPDSRRGTWDIVAGRFGPDVVFIDAALAHTFARVAVDRRRLAIGGFSDGASAALSLGTVNGDLFAAIIAFSPGFVAPGERRGFPRIFISHGRSDEVLPINQTGRRVVAGLQDEGYRVTYREFDGPHTVPAATARQAFEWLVK